VVLGLAITALERSAGYAIGYLTWRCIAETFGEPAMFRFFQTPGPSTTPPANPSGGHGRTPKRDCAAYIRAAVS
jgi:hypothetical protein